MEPRPQVAAVSSFGAAWRLPRSPAEHLVVFTLVLQQIAPNVMGQLRKIWGAAGRGIGNRQKGEHSAFACSTGALAGRFGRRSFTKRRIPFAPAVSAGRRPHTWRALPVPFVAFCRVHGATVLSPPPRFPTRARARWAIPPGDTAANVPVRRKQRIRKCCPRPARSAVPVRHQIPQFRHLLNSAARGRPSAIGGHGGAANHAEMAPPSRQFPPGRHIPKPSRTVEAC